MNFNIASKHYTTEFILALKKLFSPKKQNCAKALESFSLKKENTIPLKVINKSFYPLIVNPRIF